MSTLSAPQALRKTVTEKASARVTGGITGAIERPLLLWLAHCLPQRITPDLLTITGVVGAVITCAGYVLSTQSVSYLWLASAGLLVNWFGDSLDGTLARVRRNERPRYGFLIDHTTDLASQILIGLGLGLSPFLHFDVACIALIMFLAFVSFSMMKAVVTGELQISYGGIGPTEVRCALVGVNTLLVWHRPQPLLTLWEPMSGIDLSVLSVCAVAGVVLIVSAVVALRQAAHREK